MKAFDRLCEVQSDKANVEITSRYDGIITAVHHAEGNIVKVCVFIRMCLFFSELIGNWYIILGL